MKLATAGVIVTSAAAFGAHKSQAHLPLSPSLPPLPNEPGVSAALYSGAPTTVVYGQAGVEVGGDPAASVAAALVTPLDAQPEYFHEWAVTHPREGLAYFECPTGFAFRPSTKSCIMMSYVEPTESCPYGAYRDKVTKHCVHTDSVAPDRTCPSGFGYFMRGCIRRAHIEPSFTCSPGYSRIGRRCYSMTSVSALIECPEQFVRTQNDFLSVDDVIAVHGSMEANVCKTLAMYPPTFKCENDGRSTHPIGDLLVTVAYQENVTVIPHALTESSQLTELSELTIPFYQQPLCERPLIKATQTCPHQDFEWLPAHQAYSKLLALHEDLIRHRIYRAELAQDSSNSYLSKLLNNLANMNPDANVCLNVTEVTGTVSCPPGHSLVKIDTDVLSRQTPLDVICLEVPLSTRALNERSKLAARKDKRLAERRHPSRRLSDLPANDPPRISEHHALTPILTFGDNEFCGTLGPTDLKWSQSTALCYEVKIAEPIFQCAEGRVVCKWLEGLASTASGQCTTVCDTSDLVDPSYLAQVICEPGDTPGTKTLVDVTTKAEVASVPVCLRDIYTPPTTICPFGLGEPDPTDLRCSALGISDLILSCPEGYTKVSAEKADEDLLNDRKNSKRHATGSLASDVLPEVCELLEYAEYQVTCPTGYHREKARNTVHACVAEKLTKPSLVCPAGYLPNDDDERNGELELDDDKACIKIIEIAPTLVNPSSALMSDNLEDHKHASRGEVTACILTKTGGLSCGTERKYHGQTDLESQEKFGLRYQDKYQRKTTRQKR